MLSSIHPLGERSRQNRWAVTAGAFVVGATLGGMVLGLAAAGLGAGAHALVGWTAGTALGVAVVVVLASIVGDAMRGGRALPWPQRQVDEDWLATYRGWVYGAGFGVQLGLGVVTYVTTLGVVALVVIIGLGGDLVIGIVAGAAFGLTRGLSILTVSTIRDPAGLRAFHRRMADAAGPVRRLTLGTQTVTLAVIALAMVLA